MHSAVKSRIDPVSKTHGWDMIWHGRKICQKDGYEVYFFSQNDGFELTVRDPETMERKTVLEVRDTEIDTSSPSYIATLQYVLRNAENIVSQCE